MEKIYRLADIMKELGVQTSERDMRGITRWPHKKRELFLGNSKDLHVRVLQYDSQIFKPGLVFSVRNRGQDIEGGMRKVDVWGLFAQALGTKITQEELQEKGVSVKFENGRVLHGRIKLKK